MLPQQEKTLHFKDKLTNGEIDVCKGVSPNADFSDKLALKLRFDVQSP